MGVGEEVGVADAACEGKTMAHDAATSAREGKKNPMIKTEDLCWMIWFQHQMIQC